jgi:hypothetical protein
VLHRRPLRHRVGAAAAVAVLPLAALTACGSSDDKGDTSPTGGTTTKGSDSKGGDLDLAKLKDNALKSKSASFSISLDDSKGAIKKAVLAEDPTTPAAIVDRIVGGKITIKVSSKDKSLAELQASASDSAETLKQVDFQIKIDDKDGQLVDLRVVSGVLYAALDVNKVDQILTESGETMSLSSLIDQGASFSPDVATAGKDLKDGKYLKLDLNPYINQISGLLEQTAPSAAPSAAVNSQKLADDLLAAIKPSTQITDAGDGKYDVEIQAKAALTAAYDVLSKSDIPGFEALDPTELNTIKDGTVKAQIKVDGDHLESIRIDLQSIVAVAPDDASSPAPDLTGSSLVIDFDDDAGAVGVPDKLSGVNLDALVGQLAGAAFGGN